MSLKIASNLSLPHEAVTQTFAILAKRGVGKTYTASVMAEEMLKANLQTIIVDPIGVWWGLRTGADGKSPGLSIIIAGGDHADVPITPNSGELIANLIVNERISLVIDLSLFRKGEQTKFMTDFAETLYHKNRSALHLILDEADAFAPQRPMKGQERMLGAIEDLVRRGRARGIGVTLITQRPAVLNKDVLTQVEVLVTLRLIAPQDRNAIDEWVKVHGEPGQREELMESLPSLPIGTAWFWSPGFLDIFKRVQVRKRETMDSSSTPKVGKLRAEPKKMAEVDLDAIRKQLAETIERVEADDPKVLRRRIIELQKQLADSKPQVKVERVEVPVIPDAVLTCINMVFNDYQMMGEHINMLEKYVGNYEDKEAPKFTKPTIRPTGTIQPPKRFDRIATAKRDLKEGDLVTAENAEVKLGPGELKILIAAGQYKDGATRSQLTILTGYKRSSRNTYISRLVQRGLVEADGDTITITEAGIAELGDNYDPLPTGEALRRRLLNELPVGEKSILQMLIEQYPNYVDRDEISERTGYQRSSRNTYLSRMSAREIIEVNGSEIKAADNLFAEVR